MTKALIANTDGAVVNRGEMAVNLPFTLPGEMGGGGISGPHWICVSAVPMGSSTLVRP